MLMHEGCLRTLQFSAPGESVRTDDFRLTLQPDFGLI